LDRDLCTTGCGWPNPGVRPSIAEGS